MASIRVLAIVPEPVDAAWSPAAGAAWGSLERWVREQAVAGGIELVRLAPASANALSERTQHETFDVVHFIGRGSSRPAARHGTLTLEASDRRARDLNAQNFAKACAGMAGLKMVVLQPLGAPSELDVLRDALAERVALVQVVPASDADGGREAAGRCVALYMAVRGHQRVSERLASESTPEPVVAPPATTPVREAAPAREAAALAAQRQLEGKRAAGAFDVFLCHNVVDKPAVLAIAERLMAHGVLPWLDQWELRPGLPWQRVLEEQISRIRAAAVFVGSDGIGPWQRQELDGFLREFNNRGCPVIPVMLPGAGGEPALPLFLRAMTWVDFRVPAPDPLSHLLWGITGVRAS
jgi:hypothetical protein